MSKLHEVIKTEHDFLSAKPDHIAERAGVKKLAKFRQYPQLRTIMKAHNISLKDAEDMPYKEAFMVLLYEKEVAEIDSNYQRIAINERKR